MSSLSKFRLALTTSVAALLLASAVSAQEVVNWVHIEQNPDTVRVFEEIAAGYEALHPDVDIKLQYLENEAYKARLPTMLQSNDAPDIFYSWGGGVLAEQVKGGVLRDISSFVDDAWKTSIAPSAFGAFTVDGKVYGVPVRTSLVGFFYNKKLFADAGIDATTLGTWSGLLAAVDKLEAAGITPMALGGQEGWPQHFYFSYLAIRTAGHEKLNAALAGEGEGFRDPAFVQAFQLLADLSAKNPWQEGWQAATTGDSYAKFGNGEAAMLLQGDWAKGLTSAESASGQGLGDDLGWLAFPQVETGIADSKETFGGVNGWIFFKDAPDAAVDFVRYYSSPENLIKLANEGAQIAPMPGMAAELQDPWQQMVAQTIEASAFHQNFYNVMFSEEVNRELLDIVTSVVTGDRTAEEAADALQTAWEFSH